ncbi:hypothetical protein KIN20_029229 [Parelaphostrongylus tenuis]|uniref:Uncharacterized protein n=1 Tax=Parelaphostrongylus tenuis TaxID=148309 RepID=A0AAD5R2C8_PARTN|nr:hypothetical protein KIN20_029229 [Parelaphostrongylus tenuis]
MYCKDPKTRAEAGECVGELCLMIPPAKLVEDLKKLVSTITRSLQESIYGTIHDH